MLSSGNGFGNNVISNSGNSTGVINNGDFNGILSGNIINSFNDNSINFYSNNNDYYFAKVCTNCGIVRVDTDCGCYTTQSCPTCKEEVKPIAYNVTAPLSTSMGSSTETISPITIVFGKVEFNIDPYHRSTETSNFTTPFPFHNSTSSYSGGPAASSYTFAPTPEQETPILFQGSGSVFKAPIVGLTAALAMAFLL
ncbi:hypothetical protein FGG08_000208 [Glutinoglossum americanum]|uniref:Uncharacterized protein n=1 Tax=Glutinoglossum americanum TaxID=1670608 RepID=A0A9P8I9Q5_9PEZI|nr:hypothetical protein FGG08_000208 [Glutinoglossum americanum]